MALEIKKGWFNIWANSPIAIVPTAMSGQTHCQYQWRVLGDSRGRRHQLLEVEVEVNGSVVDFMEGSDSSNRSIGLINMAPPLETVLKIEAQTKYWYYGGFLAGDC